MPDFVSAYLGRSNKIFRKIEFFHFLLSFFAENIRFLRGFATVEYPVFLLLGLLGLLTNFLIHLYTDTY